MTVVIFMQSRRERNQHDKRARIIAAARQLFHSQGFEATTMAQIAAAADVAKGTLFLYAPTKADLLVVVYEAELQQLAERGLAHVLPGVSIPAALVAIFAPFFELYSQNKVLARRYVAQQLFQSGALPESAPALHGLMTGLAALIAGWQRQGRVAAELVPELAAQTTFMLYFGILVAWLRGNLGDEARDQRLLAVFAMHWHGFLLDTEDTP
ncbi:MAG TPA: TetR/AcrR family transcriptional regulator [Roseiflexaceae bacterium]|nr:TetR/AcrR family transcriptional regulator [Roseiflexaceae bacterium]